MPPTIKSLEILGYRGFATRQTLHFASPSGKRGSGLTVLVGTNNSGKSSAIEALRMFVLHEVSFTEGRRNREAGNRVELTLTEGNGTARKIKSISTGGSQTEPAEVGPWGDLLVVPPRRHFAPFFGIGSRPRNSYLTQLGVGATRSEGVNIFPERLFNVQKNRQNFDEILGRILKPLPKWYLEQADGGLYYVKFEFSGASHNSDGAGDGLLSLLFLVDALYDSNPRDAIAVDEPELSLHPSIQRRLADVLLDYSKDRQIVLATHSPYFVSAEALANGAEVSRVYVGPSGGSQIARVEPDLGPDLSRLVTDQHNPHVFGLDAREVFFLEDGVILVEGQEDVVGYRRIANEIGTPFEGEFYGWGVGGAPKMPLIARLLRSLGFRRVVGILDGNQKVLAAQMNVDFPQYKFVTIDADDVRSKPAAKAKLAVDGLLDHQGKILPQYHDHVRDLVSEVNAALRAT